MSYFCVNFFLVESNLIGNNTKHSYLYNTCLFKFISCRKLEIPSTENEVCAELNYDTVKNAIIDVENGLNELRKKVKATKKAREQNRRKDFEDTKQLLLDDIHSKINSLNSVSLLFMILFYVIILLLMI